MITVVGAGPAGCYYASKEKGDDVTIIEEDRRIGKPVSCTGIVTSAIDEYLKIPQRLITNKISNFNIISPSGKEIFLKLKDRNIILDRAAFDVHLADLAVDNGAKIRLNERFEGLTYDCGRGSKTYTLATSRRRFASDIVVGADGPFSHVAKSAGLFKERKFIYGWQARCMTRNEDTSTTQVFMNRGEFAWNVPEDEHTSRIGIVGTDAATMALHYKRMLHGCKVLEHQNGPIPLYNPHQAIAKNNVFLLGDAATHVKATTYGGIIYGLIDASILASDKARYGSLVRKKIGKELWLSLKVRQLLNKTDDRQIDEMISIFEDPGNKVILEKSDRNYPSRFIFKLLMREPRLWGAGLKILSKFIF